MIRRIAAMVPVPESITEDTEEVIESALQWSRDSFLKANGFDPDDVVSGPHFIEETEIQYYEDQDGNIMTILVPEEADIYNLTPVGSIVKVRRYEWEVEVPYQEVH